MKDRYSWRTLPKSLLKLRERTDAPEDKAVLTFAANALKALLPPPLPCEVDVATKINAPPKIDVAPRWTGPDLADNDASLALVGLASGDLVHHTTKGYIARAAFTRNEAGLLCLFAKKIRHTGRTEMTSINLWQDWEPLAEWSKRVGDDTQTEP
jgi:hypothetical protein